MLLTTSVISFIRLLQLLHIRNLQQILIRKIEWEKKANNLILGHTINRCDNTNFQRM